MGIQGFLHSPMNGRSSARCQANAPAEQTELGVSQPLRKEVRDIEVCAQISHANFHLLNILTNLEIADVDVFAALRRGLWAVDRLSCS